MTFEYRLEAQDGSARAGTFHTPHGVLQTPLFAPVGTLANVKTLTPRHLHEVGASLVLSNTYHLYLRPGDELVKQMGGLHRFMAWDGPILTDSGGFQVFSLAPTRQIDADGATFTSHIDGSKHRLTPEKSVQIQENLGADIIMCFDECTTPDDRTAVEAALERTQAWAMRCLNAKTRPDQALFGIVQGGIFPELRSESAAGLTGHDFPGFAIGGLAVGETKAQMYATLDHTAALLPADKPRYLMGVGSPEDLVHAVARGIDFFDCVLPTRLARHGSAMTRQGRLNMRNAHYKDDNNLLETGCTCYTCQTFTRAYVHHLIRAKEILGLLLLTLHNVHMLITLMHDMRAAILTGTFASFAQDFLDGYAVESGDRHPLPPIYTYPEPS